jgi:hypothetical protein
MGWNPYHLDKCALKVVLAARDRDRDRDGDSLIQAYKMRATCAYGLERFWGEYLRLAETERNKADFLKDVWCEFVEIMALGNIVIPKKMASKEEAEDAIQQVADALWSLPTRHRQASLAVLINFCDAVVWWTQRLKKSSQRDSL